MSNVQIYYSQTQIFSFIIFSFKIIIVKLYVGIFILSQFTNRGQAYEYTIHRQVDGYEWNSYLTWWKKFIPHVMEMNSYLKWWLKIHTRVAVGHEWYEFFTITRGKNSFPSHAVWIFSITRGKNFIHTHPLGDELYSCDVLLIDNMIPKLLQKSQI